MSLSQGPFWAITARARKLPTTQTLRTCGERTFESRHALPAEGIPSVNWEAEDTRDA